MSVRLKYPNGIAVCVCVCLECNSLHRFWLNVIDNLLCLFMQRCVVLLCWFPSVVKVGIGITGHLVHVVFAVLSLMLQVLRLVL